MIPEADFIVIGSGATGSMAAQTLVDGGARVLMLDAGVVDDRYRRLVPSKSFVAIRRTDQDQFRYFLGEDFESAAYRKLGVGAQLTPPRRYIVERVDEFLKLRSDAFTPLESLALGGLASGWGLMCAMYSRAELQRASLPVADMLDAYQIVADRIGICGAADDDARPFTYGSLARIQPPLPLDPTAAHVAARYDRHRSALRARGYSLGRPALALLAQAKDGRSPAALHDMEFYSDEGESAWRPRFVIEALRRRSTFAYVGDSLATRFEERDEGGVDVVVLDLNGGPERRYSCRRLVLACGALGSARVVLRSTSNSTARLPLLCNDYTYLPCIVPARIGRSMPERNHSLTQLAIFHDADGRQADVAVGTIFSYRALMLFRLLRHVPLGVRDARILMQYLLSGFAISGFDHPQAYSEDKCVWLEHDPSSPTHDRLAIAYDLTAGERADHAARERGFVRALRTLGAWPIERIHPPLGSSIHYGGTLPFAGDERPLTLSRDGRLQGTRAVYVADGSGFTFLPAKGVTFSLMANAHRVAKRLAETGAG
jgi:choline dehydrogenase-like flavoprotein